MAKHGMVTALVHGAILLAALITAGVAQGQTPTTNGAERIGPCGSTDGYRIGAEDALQISVWKNEAMSRTVPVRPDGKISLPLLNDVQAAGLTALELRDVLARKLAEYMPSPEVAVIVTDIRSLKVSVMGEVARPGRFELKSCATVLDMLAMAGGFTQFASRSRIVVLRPNGTAMTRIPFNYTRIAGEQENFYLRNGDIVLVP